MMSAGRPRQGCSCDTGWWRGLRIPSRGEPTVVVDQTAEHRAGNDPVLTRIRVRGLRRQVMSTCGVQDPDRDRWHHVRMELWNARQAAPDGRSAPPPAPRALPCSDLSTSLSRRLLPAQRALTTRARAMRATDAGKTSMSALLLNAEAAPEGAALWLQMIQEQNPGYNPRLASGRLHGRLTCTEGP